MEALYCVQEVGQRPRKDREGRKMGGCHIAIEPGSVTRKSTSWGPVRAGIVEERLLGAAVLEGPGYLQIYGAYTERGCLEEIFWSCSLFLP